MKIFSGNSNRQLALDICQYLGQDLGELDIKKFSDGELSVSFKENIRNEDVFIIQSTNPPAENIMELLLILDAAKRASARSVIAVIPYFGYSRQDRKDKPRVPISARLMLDLFSAARVDRIVSMDLHSSQIQGFVNVPFDHLYSRIALFDHLKNMNLNEENGVVLAPDVGSAKMSQAYAKALGVSFALIDKRRPKAGVSEVMNIIGDVEDRHCIMVDDIVDSGGTLCNAAVALMKAGALSVDAYVTHGVLSGGAVSRVAASPLNSLVTTNSIPATEAVSVARNIRQLSIAPLLGEAMLRINEERSVSTLF